MACLVQNTSSVDITHGAKRLKKDWDSNSSSSWSPLYGGGTLDQEAIQYIHKFYCKDCRMEEQAKAAAAAASGESPSGGEAVDEPTSPQSSLEEMSLQQSMDKNKESLKRKLMMRRSVNELVDQGIYPPLKTPPAFAEQRKHLERAKTGDLLRHKIQHRPDRQVLVQQHILEDTKIDPSLHERQRKLKRARIADDLNDKLSHRPGPLELIEGNILETDNENFKTAIQDGSLSFNRTFDNDDATNFGFDDDGTTSDSSPSPWHDGDSSMSDIGSPPISSVPEPPLTFQFKQRTTVPTPSVSSPSIVSMALSKLSPITTQSFSITNTSPVNSHGLHIASKLSQSSNLNKNNRLKKPKPKTQPKTKVIKFHEYKGPPNVVKTQTATGASAAAAAAAALNNPNSETPYHILLQQQQLFLQWQLEFQSKNLNMPVTLVPAEQPSDTSLSQQPPQIPAPITLQPQSSTVTQVVMTSSVTTSPTTVTSTPLLQGQPALTSPTIQTVVPQAVVPQTLLQGKPGIATVIKKPNGQTIIQTTPKPVGQPKPQLTAQPQVQLHTAPPSQLQPPLQGQPQVQKTAIVKSVSTPLLNQQKTQQISRPINQSAKASSQSTILKPLVNLEDMKVADLKVELKKRNLTVSGAKPQLIERLKPYIDVIVAPANSSANANSAVSAVSKLPVHAVVNVKSLGTSSSSSLSSNEITMSSSSPPCSPLNTDRIMKPMSPEVMDTAPSTSVLTAQMKNSLNSSHNSIPMAVDTSRPPSVNPDSEMEIDNTLDLSGGLISLSKGLTSPPATTTTITFVTSPRQAQVQQIQIVQPKVVSISPTAQNAQPKVVYTSPGTQIVQPSLINSSPVTSPQQNVVPSSPEISHEDILQQQRLKIEQLQKQLEESQKRLKLQQMQHQHLQEQQKQLNQLQQQQSLLLQQPTSPDQIQQQAAMLQQQQPNSPPQLKHQQPKSPPQVQVITKPVPSPQLHQSPSSPQQPLQTMTVSVSADGKISPVPQSILKNTKFVPVGTPQTVNVVQTPSKGQQVLQGLPITSQGISSVVMTNTSDKVVKAGTDFFKTHNNLQSNVNIVKPMTSLVNPNTVTFQQPSKPGTKTRTVTLSPINGIAQNNKTVSLPSSPVDTKNMVLRTSSTPYFIPMREPPKYDEAIKNRINQGHLLGEGSKLDGKPVIKSQAMDDVLEILIRNGELPPSAAQEPPPTPKTLTQTGNIPTSATVTMATVASSSSSTQLQQFSMFTTATSMVTTATISSTSSMSDVDALLNQPVHTPVPLIKPECITPPPLTFGVSTPPSQLVLNEPASSDSADLYDIDEMLNRDLSSMDWADDPTFLELSDTTCMQTDQEIKPGLLTVPCSESSSAGNSHGSEPDLAALGINDPDNSQMDVSDWLDVIMPSTGLTPLSANAPVSFPSDPILTPKTQQEVLELFNFEDGDFGTPTEFQGGLNWEKLTETTTS